MWFARFKRRWIVMMAILVVGMLLFIKQVFTPVSIHYQTANVVQRDLEQNVLAMGELDAVRTVDVGAQVSGQLEHLYLEIGDQVKKGQLLAMIDPQQPQNLVKESEANLQELDAQLSQARAELQLADVTLRRQQSLSKMQAVSQQDLDQARTDLAAKKAKIGAIKAQIAKHQAGLATAKINLGYTRISAPMDGEVVKITTLQGQTVIAAQQAPTILTLADMRTMLVNAQVSEADVIHLKPGLTAWFTVLGDPNKRFNGVLKDIQPMPKKVNEAIFYHARFEVPNPDGLLRLQMTAQVQIQLASVEQATVIPLSALGDEVGTNRYHVTLLKQGKEEKREVTIGIRNNVEAQILAGLNIGDVVIISRGGTEKK